MWLCYLSDKEPVCAELVDPHVALIDEEKLKEEFGLRLWTESLNLI